MIIFHQKAAAHRFHSPGLVIMGFPAKTFFVSIWVCSQPENKQRKWKWTTNQLGWYFQIFLYSFLFFIMFFYFFYFYLLLFFWIWFFYLELSLFTISSCFLSFFLSENYLPSILAFSFLPSFYHFLSKFIFPQFSFSISSISSLGLSF